MSYYLILFLIVCISLVISKYLKLKLFQLIPYILMALFCGFRGVDVGIDTSHYYDIFYYIENNISIKIEIGYYYLTKFVQFIGGSQQLIFLIISCLTSYFIYKFIKEQSDEFELSTLIYFCLGPFYLSSFNTMRETLTVAILLYSIKYINTSNRKFIGLILFGSFFHYSILLFVLLIFVDKFFNNKHLFKYVIVLVSILVIFIESNIVSDIIINFLPQYRNYISSHIQNMDISYVFFLILCVGITLLSYLKKIKIDKIYIELTLIAICLISAPLITKKYTMIFTRLASYVTPVIIVLLPKLKNIFEIKSKTIYKGVLIMFLFVYFFITVNSNISIKEFSFNFELFN